MFLKIQGVFTVGKLAGLKLPDRSRPDKNAFNIRPRKVAAWIDALPRANLGETARQIFTVLHDTNRLAYPYQDRIRFLEMLREPLHYITHAMRKHFIGASLPLPDKNRKIASITRELYHCMACGYKIALEDTLSYNLVVLDKKALAFLVHRSFTYTGLHILTAYQSYSAYDEENWSELHALYRFAEKKKLLKRKIRDEQHPFTEKTSLATEYARILLLALASPYHLRQGEAGKVYDALERWLEKPIIRPLQPEETGSNKFIDNLAEAHAPMALSLANATEQLDIAQLRVIETFHLSEKLQHELETTTDTGASTITTLDVMNPALPHNLLERLLVAWGMISKRFFPRKEKHEQIKITIGLNAAHEFILRQAHSQEDGQYSNKYADRAHFESTEIRIKREEVEKNQDDVWGLIYPSELPGLEPLVEQELSLQPASAPAAEKKTASPPRYHADNWLVVNESIKGMMINNDREFNNKAQVGELISIHRKPNGHAGKWSIGAIRWLKYSKDNSLQMGIEILNPNAAAVGIRAMSTPNAPLQRSLMLPELKNLKQPASLIINPVPWREGNKIIIDMLGKKVPAVLGKPLQNTGLFAQFEYTLLEKEKQAEPAKHEDSGDFTQIWSSI